MDTANNIKTRYLDLLDNSDKFDQLLFFVGQGADSYALLREKDFDSEEIRASANFLKSSGLWNEKTPMPFISLGCGTADYDAALIKLIAETIPVSYVGIDSSESMLNIAKKRLEPLDIWKHFIAADILYPQHIRSQLKTLGVLEQGSKLWAIFGGLFGNMKQDKIMEVLSQLLDIGDYLYIDIAIKLNEEAIETVKLRYLNFAQRYKIYFDRFYKITGIPGDVGHIITTLKESDDSGTATFSYEFSFNKAWGKYGKGRRIHLLDIRVFDKEGLIKKMDSYGFSYCKMFSVEDQDAGICGGTLLFQKLL